MKLIEKKCPNCGASLEFNENAKNCTCDYCHRSFEIERDEGESKDISKQYKLNELSTFHKATIAYVFGSFIVSSIIPFIIIAALTITIIFGISSNTSLIKSTSNLNNDNYEILDRQAIFEIDDSKGDTSHHSYHVDERKREKVYVAYKKDNNYLIGVYKVKYKDFLNSSDIKTIYVPLVYEKIKKNYISLSNAKIDAPEYYFDDEKVTYAYGYPTLEELYDNVIKPLESEYKITEK